jgi:hypothetical protein
VLVSDRGALPEVVGPRGVVLPCDDAAPWTAALARVLAQPFEPGRPSPDTGWCAAARSLLTIWRECAARR